MDFFAVNFYMILHAYVFAFERKREKRSKRKNPGSASSQALVNTWPKPKPVVLEPEKVI